MNAPGSKPGVKPESNGRPIRLFLLAAILFALIVALHVASAARGMPLIRPQHMGTALEYASQPINLLRPVIVGFNANGAPTALELPLWQATAGAVFKIT